MKLFHLSLCLTSVLALPFEHEQLLQKKSTGAFTIPLTGRRFLQSESGNSLKKRQSATDDEASIGNLYNVRYIASITVAGNSLEVILDSGSTDTFVISQQPDNYAGQPADDLPPLFDNSTAQGVIETGLTYNTSYGAGNGITTTLGAIELATIALDGTDLLATNCTYANLYQLNSGPGASGLLGLGFPLNGDIYLTIIQAFYEAGQTLSVEQTQTFLPIVPLMQYQGRIQNAMYSLIVDRLSDQSATPPADDPNRFNVTFGTASLTFGDYPENYTESQFTFTPVPTIAVSESYQAAGFPAYGGNRWTTAVDYVYFNGQRLTNTTQQPDIVSDGGQYYTLIDTGNPSMNLPPDMMSQITDAYAGNRAGRTIPCNTHFDLVFEIGGRNYTMNPEDMLVPSYLAEDSLGLGGTATDNCQFQAQPQTPSDDEAGPGTSITYFFGDPFLRNVAIVFDYGSFLNADTDPPRIGLAQR